MKILIVDGRLVRDAEIKVSKTTGNRFLKFTIANNTYSNGQENTTYYNVISYNEDDIARYAKFVKGKLLVITGTPNEDYTVKEDKVYINRNIKAYNIEYGTFSYNRENTQEPTQNVSVPTIDMQMRTPEVPKYTAPSVASPVPNIPAQPVQERIVRTEEITSNAYEYAAHMPPTTSMPYVDDLPF